MFYIGCCFNMDIVKTYGWMTLHFFIFENTTSWAGLLGSGFKSIFQL